MKSKILLFAILLLPVLTLSQAISSTEKNNVKKVFFIDKNGKTSHIIYDNPSGNITDFQIQPLSKEGDYESINKLVSDNNKNTYSLTLNLISDHTDLNVLIANNESSYDEGDMTWQNSSVCQIDIPEGEYEIALITKNSPQGVPTYSFVFFNNFMLQKDSVIDVDFELLAKNHIELNMVDESGNTFTAEDEIIEENITIAFPENLAWGFMGYSYHNQRLPNIRFSDLNGDYRIFTNLTCVKSSNVYSTNSYTLNSVFSDTVLCNHSEDYKSFKMIMKATPNAESMFLTFGSTFIANSQLVFGSMGSFNEKYPIHDNDTLCLLLNNKPLAITENSKTISCPWIHFWQKKDEGGIAPYKQCLNAPSPIVTDTDSIMLIEFGAHIDSSDLLFESGDAISIGGTAPHIQSWGFNESNTISTYPMFLGQYSEKREADGNYSTYRIIHDNQVIDSGNLDNDLITYNQVEPETYTWELTNPNYAVHQKQGKAILSATFDLGNQDPNFPILTSLKIINHNDVIGEDLFHHESASILFSTFDFVEDFTIFEEPFSVNAYYNIDGKEGWNEMLVTSHPALYDPYAFGYFYSCDLTSVLTQFDNIGYINFKIDVIDYAGNVCTQTWNPIAFVSHPLGIQQSVSFSPQSLTVAPNPVNGHCVIGFNLPEAAQSELMVFDINGKLVENILSSKLDAGNHQISWSPSPSLTKGTYLIKLITAKDIKTSKVFIH